ncbi:hypothetical protein MMC20_002584 [Loxospora ochrophaea]|nr:hypothetical protein [Loxospora ochrophaea]
MATVLPTRKSLRTPKPNRKYANDAISILDVLESDSDADVPVPRNDDNDEDENFTFDEVTHLPDVEDDEHQISANEESLGPSSAATPAEEGEEDDDALSSRDTQPILRARGASERTTSPGTIKIPRPRRINKRPDEGTHVRGLPDVARSMQSPHLWRYLVGTDPQDLIPFILSRDKWTITPTLPTKNTDENGRGGMGPLFSHSEEQRGEEATTGWDWYYDRGGKNAMVSRERIETLSLDEARMYQNAPQKASHSFLMGPYGQQQMYSLPVSQSMFIEEAWKRASPNGRPAQGVKADRGQRNGWMLNIGSKIRCLDWAPNHNAETQYLAVTSYPPVKLSGQRESSRSSAFAPSEPTPANIQIWAFAVDQTPGNEGRLHPTRKPTLKLVLCTRWGKIKRLKWCPVPRNPRDGDDHAFIGLLAGVWSDGCIRVLDVRMEEENNSSTTYIKYASAGFESRPPNTICTCLAWLSGTDIAAGCGNGFVAIWNIAKSIQDGTSSSPSPHKPDPPPISTRPWLYTQIHHSYVLGIVSCYPDLPNLLTTSSMDGYTRLTDLRNPTTDYVLSQRSRMSTSVLEYCAPLKVILTTDDSDTIRVLPLRRFFTSVNIARADSQILCMAIGKCHPFVIGGCADGAVISTNPMRKVLGKKVQQYQQTLFQHEWTRKGDSVSQIKEAGGVSECTDGDGVSRTTEGIGISRITEGYKVESTKQGAQQGKEDEGIQKGMLYTTIHEEETGVTQVVWNPNVCCGGWMAAGMGSGLLRVEDVAL